MTDDFKNLTDNLLNCEARISNLEKTLNFILSKNIGLIVPTQEELLSFKNSTIEELKLKYPVLNIKTND